MKKFFDRIGRTCFLVFFCLFAVSCASTKPALNHSGGNYHSVSDDIIINNSLTESIGKIANNLNPQKKVLVVQVVDDAQNDYIADRIFEELYKRGFVVGKTKNLKNAKIGNFDKFLVFYPTVYGTEHAETRPRGLAKYLPFALGYVLFYHDDRQAGVSIHCRLVDGASGRIDWIKDFTGQSKVRLKSGTDLF